MSPRVKWAAGIATLLLMVAAWWFLLSEQGDTSAPEARATTPSSETQRPRFSSRSASGVPPLVDGPRARPTQEALSLAYPEGALISCPAPDLADGPYRVIGSMLAHLRVEDSMLVGALTKPSEGSGLLMTQRGHPVAEFQWSEAGCQMEPLVSLKLPGVVVDSAGEPVADVELVGCVGDVTKSGEDGSFWLKIVAGQSCWPFAFREDEEGLAKGAMVEVVGGETEHLELQVPGESMSASKQREFLQQGAHQMLNLLEREHTATSPVAAALERHPDNAVLQAWSDDEIEWLNLRYEDVEYLISGEANEEDWRDMWLFGVGM